MSFRLASKVLIAAALLLTPIQEAAAQTRKAVIGKMGRVGTDQAEISAVQEGGRRFVQIQAHDEHVVNFLILKFAPAAVRRFVQDEFRSLQGEEFKLSQGEEVTTNISLRDGDGNLLLIRRWDRLVDGTQHVVVYHLYFSRRNRVDSVLMGMGGEIDGEPREEVFVRYLLEAADRAASW